MLVKVVVLSERIVDNRKKKKKKTIYIVNVNIRPLSAGQTPQQLLLLSSVDN